jgi:Protein of unknown function (DUF2804).
MQHKITRPSRLLNKKGELIQKGYATKPLLEYCRKDVACKLRLKEWDYYLIYNDDYAFAVTLGKNDILTLISASLIDFSTNKEYTKSVVRAIPEKCLSMPQSSEIGDIVYHDREVTLSFRHLNGNRELFLSMKNFWKTPEDEAVIIYQSGFVNSEEALSSNDLEATFTLSNEPQDSMVIATPFYQSKKDFYYNQKIIGMTAEGNVQIHGRNTVFSPLNSFGLLDWGRGVWPYKTTWYWSACQGWLYGNVFGFNLGYGFGDTSAATENMLFLNGIASKLDKVTFHIPKNEENEYEYMKPWTITSSDRRLYLTFTPKFDRSVNLSAVVLSTNQNQVFGNFTGNAVLDDGTIIYLKDFFGFAERVENRW